jgi:hypothetical protein
MTFPIAMFQTFLGNGYFGGGNLTGSSPYSSEIDGIQFNTEAAINPSAALSVARFSLCGVNSSTRGYFGGGGTPSFSFEIDGIQFNTEAAINPSAALSVDRSELAGVNSSIKGYFGGGRGTIIYSSEIDGIQFDTEAAINPSAALSVARNSLAGINSNTRGYFGGGTISGNTTTAEIDGIQFDTEAAINPSAALSVARNSLAGINSTIRGYFGGGRPAATSSPTTTAEIDGIQFDTEAAINPSAALSVARNSLAGINSTIRGYFGGGWDSLSYDSRTSEIDGIQFDTEAAINPSAALSVSRYALTGVQWGAL